MKGIADMMCRATLAGVVAAAVMLVQSTPTRAAGKGMVSATTGIVGLASGETARLNVLNASDLVSVHPEPKRVDLKFVDSTGTVLGESTQTVAPGQAVFFDLPAMTTGPMDVTGGRMEIRGVVTPGSSPCVSTLEIFDSRTGRTSAVIPGITVTCSGEGCPESED